MPLVLAVIECTMLWPGEKDDEQRHRACDRSVVEYFKRRNEELTETDKADLFALADAAHPLPAIQAAARKPFLHGMIAGNVLHNVVGLIACCGQDNVSLGKAIRMAVPPGKQLSVSTFNSTVWPKFRCVAHLWAAYYRRALFDARGVFPCTLDDLPAFLADAEGYRILGESWKIKQSPEPAILLAFETIRFLPEGPAIEPTDLRFEMESGRKL
jgi:hypothetical protein